ncbi:MAG: penicillin acylase family protein [Leptonema sp. (in: bacteria)]
MKKVLLLALFLFILFVVGAYFLVQSVTPSYEKDIDSEKIKNPIKIFRDEYQMPIVLAESEEEASFGLGYTMAQDRLFQMDLIRRAIQGKLSEILGESLIHMDKFFLTITAGRTLEEMYKDYPEEYKKQLQYFSDGVNTFIEQNPLPIEFRLLGYKPDLWTPIDSISIFYYMCFDLNTSYDTEILFYLLVDQLGFEKAKELYPDYVPKKGEILELSKLSESNKEILFSFLEILEQSKEFLISERVGASNNWVIAPFKSETETPIVASDMHLSYGLPPIWYEAQVITPNFNVSGLLLPGIPTVVVGANENVAWAFTNVMADDADFYIEKLNPKNPNQYLYKNQYFNMEIQKKIFKLKNKEEVFEIKKTIHGPILNSIYPLQTDEVFSMRWTAYDQYQAAIALYLANRAKNIQDIEKATEYFKTPGQNWVYADKDGNIGFTAAVAIPIRPGFNGLLPMPGWTGTYEWLGYVPTNLQPRIRNPKKGWIATANNKFSSSYPYVISNYYHYPDRYERIKEILNSKQKISIEDVQRLQTDIYSKLAEDILPILLQDLSDFDFSKNLLSKKSYEVLQKWNYSTDADSIASSVFHVLLKYILKNTYEKHIGTKYYNQYLKKQFIPVNALRIQLQNPNSFWFDDPETTSKETRKDIIHKSFLDALEELNQFSKDFNQWQWGHLHLLEFNHPFGKNKFLRYFFNKGPFPVSGSLSTVNPMDFSLNQNLPFKVRSGASERYIMLPGKMEDSLRILPGSVSENPLSFHYGNQIPLFLKNQYRKFTLKKPNKKFTYKTQMNILPKK